MASRNNRVAVLCWAEPGPHERNAKGLADALGAQASIVPAARFDFSILSDFSAVVVHAATLRKMAGAAADGDAQSGALLDAGVPVFAYGFEASKLDDHLIQVLSSGALLGFERLAAPSDVFQVLDTDRNCCGVLSGQIVASADATRDGSFRAAEPRDGRAAIVRVGEHPFFVRMEAKETGAEVFFAGCNELADLENVVPRAASLLPWFSRLAPLAMFLRKILGKRVWHGDGSQGMFHYR